MKDSEEKKSTFSENNLNFTYVTNIVAHGNEIYLIKLVFLFSGGQPLKDLKSNGYPAFAGHLTGKQKFIKPLRSLRLCGEKYISLKIQKLI